MNMTEFILPQSESISSVPVELKSRTSADVQVKYRDTSGVNAGTKQVTASKLNFDLTQGFDEQILSSSVRFKVGADTFIDRTVVS